MAPGLMSQIEVSIRSANYVSKRKLVPDKVDVTVYRHVYRGYSGVDINNVRS